MQNNADSFFYLPFTVPDYECDINNKMKLSYFMRHLQEVSTTQLDSLNLGYQRLYSEGTVFLMSKLGIKINRMPTAQENVLFRTSPQGIKGAQFRRESYLETESGEILGMAQSIWAIVDPETWRIVRPSAFSHKLAFVPEEKKMQGDIGVDRVRAEGDIVLNTAKHVGYSDLDLNNHLNNCSYADIITDALPFEQMKNCELEHVFIHYHNQAVWKDEISVTTQKDANNWYYITGLIESGKCFEAKVLFK
jgi:Acyl-ACP thioesterase